MSENAKINLEDFFRYFDESVTTHKEGVALLAEAMPARLLVDSAPWVKAYRGQLPHQQQEEEKGEALVANPLSVPYDCQLDNPSGEGWRECFSSSCAMAAMYWGVIDSPNQYHAIRPKYGDSTDPSAQIRTLQSLGLDARFVQVGSVEKLKAQIDRGRPAPVGFLHHGTPSAPSGGGHYICAIGYTDTHLIAHDPYGELDVVNGGYPKTGGTYGKEIYYSWKNWAPRWSVANDNDGWGIDVFLPGKSEGGSNSAPTETAEPGLELIKSFEGCELQTYVCPSGVLTIGYGHTGSDVYQGQEITMAVANDLLKSDLVRFESAVCNLITVPLTQNEFDATVSFAFNCGEGALSESTFRKRMNAGENKSECFKQEFPKWVNGPNGPLPGLVNRRNAEIALACKP